MLKIAAAYAHREPLADNPGELRSRLLAVSGTNFRRINRYTELALLGALHCGRAGIAPDTALYLVSESPMMSACVKALDSLVAKQTPPTPFEFMNLSGNMAGFYIAQQLRMAGPQLALHGRGVGIDSALDLLRLQSGAHRRGLVGHVEEGAWPLAEHRERLALRTDQPLSECSHWLYLDADCPAPLAIIQSSRIHRSLREVEQALATLPAGSSLSLIGSLAEEVGAVWPTHFGLQRLRNDQHGDGAATAAIVAYALNGNAANAALLSQGRDGRYRLTRMTRP